MKKYPAPTILARTSSSQLRVGISIFKDVPRLDIREWRVFPPNKDFKPTKHGLVVPPGQVESLLAAIALHGAELPVKVTEVLDATHWVIVKRDEDAAFHKKNVFKTESEARDKNPPDGYAIFKLQVEKGTVTRQKRVANRVKQRWVDCK
jgi:Transcriptional Coactivator p15 (PC4)